MPEILSIGELLDLGNSANMSAYIPYSGLEYNASGAISGISGSAIAGGIESSVVSSIVSSMVSGKADQSAVEDCCSAMSAEVSAKLDASASSLFQPSGNYQPSGDYYSATNPSGFITTAELSAYVAESSYSSFTSEVTNNISSISSTVSGLTGTYIEQSASGMFAPSGDYAYNSSLSSKLDASSSSLFAPSGDYAYNSALSSYIPQSSSGQFAPSGDYAYASALSSKLDASASSDFYSTSNPSGFITRVDLSEYQEKSGMSAYQLTADMSAYAYASSVSARDYSGINPVEVDNVERLIGVTSKELRFGSGLAVSSDADSDTVYVTAQGGGGGDQYVPLSSTGWVTMHNSELTVSSTHGLYVGDGNYTVRLNSSEVALTDTASQISAVMNKSGISGASGSRTLWSYGSAEHEKLYSAYSFLSGHSAILWGNDNNAQSTSLTIGSSNTATMASLAQGLQCQADYSSVALGSKCTAYANSVAVGYSSKADSSATAFGSSLSAVNKSFVIGQNNKLGRNFGDSGAFVIGNGTASGYRHDLMAVTTDGEITVYSATSDAVGLPLVATLRAISAWAVTKGWTGM